jgi:NodT family efflux transporter outer membrane factor (OMF) lipoprotein
MMFSRLTIAGWFLGASILSGCTAVGPDYERPSVAVPAVYKEIKGWKPAQPKDSIDRDQWWLIFHDPALDHLMSQLVIGNQNLRAYEATYRQALAEIRVAQAALFPTVTGGPSISRARTGGASSTVLTLEGTASWEPDLWGKVHRQIESNVAGAQASAAMLASVRLSAQATLATTYFALCYEDALKQLYEATIKNYKKSLEITQNQYGAGVAARSDVVQAQTQLESAQAAIIGIDLDRAKYEHLIALLVGVPPAEMNLRPQALTKAVPGIPVSLPSPLLERRPDIAQQERYIQQQSEQIGIAVAAYYPNVDLVAVAGFSGDPGKAFFRNANAIWSIAGTATETIFDGGARAAAVDVAQEGLAAAVANYRQTVLAAYQDVEDEIASQRILAAQYKAQETVIQSAQRAVEITLNEYRAGIQTYTTVLAAQSTALANEQALLILRSNRLEAAVSLIRALGGGWSTASLPEASKLRELDVRF